MPELVIMLEMAVAVEDREDVARIAGWLSEAAAMVTTAQATIVARHLGAASALLGDRARARERYEQALEVAAKVRFRPEAALTHLQLAELLMDDALAPPLSKTEREQERAEALAHLDIAIEEFRAMKMQPSLERALRHKGLLRA